MIAAVTVVLIFASGANSQAGTAETLTPAQILQSTQLKSGGACPAGYRALTLTNNCAFGVYIGENLSQPQVDGTPTCSKDSDCTSGTVNSTLRCVAGAPNSASGLCTLTCTTDADCGPNQTCFLGHISTGVDAWYDVNSTTAVGECWFSNLQPKSLSSPTPTSNWQLQKNGGKAVICLPEAQENPAGAKLGASCTQNSDCASKNCYDPNAPAHQCTPGDSNCRCGALFSWSGNFWGRTQCSTDSQGNFSCQTGNCGAANGQSGRVDCSGNASRTPTGGQNPENLSEFTLLNPLDGGDTYDTSMVNGFNVGFGIAPVTGTYTGAPSTGYCSSPGAGCSFDLLSTCPSQLQFKDANGGVVGCWAPAQACESGTSAQKTALGCTGSVPFLCTTAADCPYGHQATPAQTLTCDIQPGQSFRQCACTQDTDCPCGYVCSGSSACVPGSGQQGPGTTATWADLYGCANYFGQLTPYSGPGARGTCPALSSTALETGIVCGCPSWSASGECKAHNINWESAPVGGTGPVASPSSSPTPSIGDLYQTFHDACATSYAYPYDDNAGTVGCSAEKTATVGPSYNITFCPSLGAPASPNPSPTPSPAKCLPSFGYLYTVPAGTMSFPAMAVGTSETQTITVTNYAGTPLKLKARIRHGDAEDFSVTGGTCKTNKILNPGSSCSYSIRLKADKDDAGGAVQSFLTIKGKYRRGACPAGSRQIVNLTVAGFVDSK
jgi:Thaumatin family